MNAIHAHGLRSPHIPRGALRSTLQYFVTCKHCQRMKGYPTMDSRDIRRMVSMVRAIKAGKWTAELPAWAPKNLTYCAAAVLQDIDDSAVHAVRAVQTAEVFILLAHASNYALDETAFIRDCGFGG